MKVTLQIMLALLSIGLIFGVILPWLVSAKSTLAVVLAIVVLAGFILLAVHTITKLIGRK